MKNRVAVDGLIKMSDAVCLEPTDRFAQAEKIEWFDEAGRRV